MKWYLVAILGAAGMSLVGLWVVSTSFDPFMASTYIHALFFTSLSLGLWGFATLGFVSLGRKKRTADLYAPLRRGFLTALLPLGLVLLARFGRFTTVSAILLVVGVSMIELVIAWRSHKNSQIEDFS